MASQFLFSERIPEQHDILSRQFLCTTRRSPLISARSFMLSMGGWHLKTPKSTPKSSAAFRKACTGLCTHSQLSLTGCLAEIRRIIQLFTSSSTTKAICGSRDVEDGRKSIEADAGAFLCGILPLSTTVLTE